MEKTFQILNQLEAADLVTHYPIGKTFAVSFYSEPSVTEIAGGARASARFGSRVCEAQLDRTPSIISHAEAE